MAEYTPTVAQVRRAYIVHEAVILVAEGRNTPGDETRLKAEFDRWLEAHDREVVENARQSSDEDQARQVANDRYPLYVNPPDDEMVDREDVVPDIDLKWQNAEAEMQQEAFIAGWKASKTPRLGSWKSKDELLADLRDLNLATELRSNADGDTFIRVRSNEEAASIVSDWEYAIMQGNEVDEVFDSMGDLADYYYHSSPVDESEYLVRRRKAGEWIPVMKKSDE